MSVNLSVEKEGKTLEILANGKLSQEDYKKLIPEVERLIKEHGKINILFEMSQFHGWEPGALWEDSSLTSSILPISPAWRS